jgi:hypothetical protein
MAEFKHLDDTDVAITDSSLKKDTQHPVVL